MKIINGKEIAQKIKSQIKEKIEEEYLSKGKNSPCLACVIVEGNSASEVYVASKEKACKECLMQSMIVRLPNDVSQETLEKTIASLNKNPKVSGILLQLPLPRHLDENRAINKINPLKDVDCLTNTNLGAMMSGKQLIAPCTATGVMQILKNESVDIAGKNAVVIGRSLLVGKSTANLLEQKNATVTLCHSKTENLATITKNADILVVAIGKPEFIKSEHVKTGAVVIDVGINRTEKGLKGDVDFDDVKDKCSLITPVPGGVGPLTVACLMENTLTLDKISQLKNSKQKTESNDLTK